MQCLESTHKYYFAFKGNCEPIDLEKYIRPATKPRRYEYYCQILLRLREYLVDLPVTVYISDSWRNLPSYGKNVFVIQHGFGYSLYPAYAPQVGAVFKNYGRGPHATLGSGSFRLDVSTIAKYVRDVAVWAPTYIAYALRMATQSGRSKSRIYSIPLGYAQQHNMTVSAQDARKYDVSFVGSLSSRKPSALSVQAMLGTPKALSRARMADALQKLGNSRPDIRIALKSTGGFCDSMGQGAAYSEILAATKICLVPRGDVTESFRYFEAMRYGCIVICEQQPDYWFYKNSPAIQIRNWEQLENIISKLVSDSDALQSLQQQSLQHWQSICSEEAVARFMAEKIRQVLDK